MIVKGYITHKDSENYSDCADYFSINPRTHRIAVSDGVSQSIMPAEWARILTKSFVSADWIPGEDVTSLQTLWSNEAHSFLQSQREAGKNPWMLANCLASKDGAGATICGVEFTSDKKWSAYILGDSCIVIINKECKIEHIYSSMDAPFGNRPDYYDSFNGMVGKVRNLDGTLDDGETMLLVSDPFSELFQKNAGSENETEIAKTIMSIDCYESFITMVDSFRREYGMHNDDSTLIIVQYDGSSSINISDEKSLDSLIEEEKYLIEQQRIERQTRINADNDAWAAANKHHSIESYESYVSQFVNGLHKKEALRQIEILRKQDEANPLTESQGNVLASDTTRCQTQCITHETLSEEATAEKGKNSSRKAPGSEKGESAEGPSEDPVCSKEEKKVSNLEPSLEVPFAIQQSQDGNPRELSGEKIYEADGIKQKQEMQAGCSSEERNTTGNHPEEVVVDTSFDHSNVAICTPPDVDSSDGIDRAEFIQLKETALTLFKKYHYRFEHEFSRQKWNTDRLERINKCFEDFWCELEGIIYKDL